MTCNAENSDGVLQPHASSASDGQNRQLIQVASGQLLWAYSLSLLRSLTLSRDLLLANKSTALTTPRLPACSSATQPDERRRHMPSHFEVLLAACFR